MITWENENKNMSFIWLAFPDRKHLSPCFCIDNFFQQLWKNFRCVFLDETPVKIWTTVIQIQKQLKSYYYIIPVLKYNTINIFIFNEKYIKKLKKFTNLKTSSIIWNFLFSILSLFTARVDLEVRHSNTEENELFSKRKWCFYFTLHR